MSQPTNFKQSKLSIKDEILKDYRKAPTGNLSFTGHTRPKRSASTGKTPSVERLYKYVDKYYTRSERKEIFGYVRPFVTDEIFVKEQIDIAIGTANAKPDFHHNTHFPTAVWLTRKMFAPPLETFVIHHNDTRMLSQNRAVNPELPYSDNKELRNDVRKRYEKGELSSPRLTYGAIENTVLFYSRKELHSIKTLPASRFSAKHFRSYTTIHQRSQLQTKESLKEKIKVRATFGHSKHSLIRDRMLRGDYNRQLRDLKYKPFAWGYEIGRGGFMHMEHELASRYVEHPLYVMTDFKAFDLHLPHTGMRMIDAIIGSYMHAWNQYFPQKLDGDERYMHAITKSDNDLYKLWKR